MAANRDRWTALGWAIVVHIVLFAIIGFGLSVNRDEPVRVAMKPIIQASAVSEEKVMEPYRERLAAEKRRIDEAKRKAEEDRRRAAEERKKAEAEKQRKLAEQKRQAELKKKQEAEKARLAAQEKQRKIEADRKAAEEKKKAEEERKRKAAEEQARRDEALKKQLDAEAKKLAQEQQQYQSARMSRLQDQYVADITNKVERNWLRPPDSRGTLCSVLIQQIPGGEIVGVQVTDCDGDVAFKRSVAAAVRKASPLPMPSEKELFQREIEFVFRPGH